MWSWNVAEKARSLGNVRGEIHGRRVVLEGREPSLGACSQAFRLLPRVLMFKPKWALGGHLHGSARASDSKW